MAVVTSAAVGAGVTLHSARQARKASKSAAKAQAQAGREAIAFQEQQAERGLGILQQFDPLIERGMAASDFLANPEAQASFLENNPIFQLALDEANAGTRARAASLGRLGAGDTDSELARNVFLAGIPLIDRQRQDVSNLLNTGIGVGTSQANILQGLAAGVSPVITDIGASNAAGIIGANNASQQGVQNLFGLFGQFAGGGAFGSELQNVFGRGS